ncbi:unnamed protein product [Cyclocybe aegerita]|uniref:Uncharacterized protein n=1 Tax=Cyclocybe aegerita TaxID=1973307 RepID=A0A8S0XRY2_CYCAE|nr:unnamed protein product [Cyclocybe aegerita]
MISRWPWFSREITTVDNLATLIPPESELKNYVECLMGYENKLLGWCGTAESTFRLQGVLGIKVASPGSAEISVVEQSNAPSAGIVPCSMRPNKMLKGYNKLSNWVGHLFELRMVFDSLDETPELEAKAGPLMLVMFIHRTKRNINTSKIIMNFLVAALHLAFLKGNKFQPEELPDIPDNPESLPDDCVFKQELLAIQEGSSPTKGYALRSLLHLALLISHLFLLNETQLANQVFTCDTVLEYSAAQGNMKTPTLLTVEGAIEETVANARQIPSRRLKISSRLGEFFGLHCVCLNTQPWTSETGFQLPRIEQGTIQEVSQPLAGSRTLQIAPALPLLSISQAVAAVVIQEGFEPAAPLHTSQNVASTLSNSPAPSGSSMAPPTSPLITSQAPDKDGMTTDLSSPPVAMHGSTQALLHPVMVEQWDTRILAADQDGGDIDRSFNAITMRKVTAAGPPIAEASATLAYNEQQEPSLLIDLTGDDESEVSGEGSSKDEDGLPGPRGRGTRTSSQRSLSSDLTSDLTSDDSEIDDDVEADNGPCKDVKMPGLDTGYAENVGALTNTLEKRVCFILLPTDTHGQQDAALELMKVDGKGKQTNKPPPPRKPLHLTPKKGGGGFSGPDNFRRHSAQGSRQTSVKKLESAQPRTFYGPHGEAYDLLPRLHFGRELALVEFFFDKIEANYVDGGPKHMKQPQESVLEVMTFETYRAKSSRDILEILCHKDVIAITKMPFKKVSFNKKGLQTLQQSFKNTISIQASQDQEGKVLNALDFPFAQSLQSLYPHTCQRHTLGLAALAWALTYWHIDSDSFNTLIDVLCGSKLWIFGVSSRDMSAMIERFLQPDFELEQPNAGDLDGPLPKCLADLEIGNRIWDLEAVLLPPNTWL